MYRIILALALFCFSTTTVLALGSASSAPPTPEPTLSLCVGDCPNADGIVTLDEVKVTINAFLQTGGDICYADVDKNGDVDIVELQQCINSRLKGCRNCPGDCIGDRVTDIGDVEICKAVFDGSMNLDECPACDVDKNGDVDITDLQAVFNASQHGCK